MPDRREYNRRDYCPDCLDAITAVCHVCGTRLPLIHNHGSDEAPLCETCLHNRSRAGIRDYCYKPRPIFYGKGPHYFGVKLEIDCGGELSDNANQLTSVANADREYIYVKHDGSGRLKICMTPIRVVCNNTLNLALGSAKRIWSMRHTENIRERMDEAKACLFHANEYMSRLRTAPPI